MGNEYKETMNLPQTDFPMRAGLAQAEPKRLQKWDEADLYHLTIQQREGKPSFILHDGPPYANGAIHIGHALNKILKDIINRYWSEKGFYTPYVPGWDCHGQPIEHKIEQKLGPSVFRATEQSKIRELCREYALENVDIQREGFKRLGVLAEWDHPYLTLNHAYEAGDVKVFKDIYLDGAIYRGRKPVHWCKHCLTALAEAEIEYADEVSSSIYVKYYLTNPIPQLEAYTQAQAIVIWTTTPWTLPANVAVALAKDADYCVINCKGELLICAYELRESVMEAAEIEAYELLLDEDGTPLLFKGSQLEGLSYAHPIHQDKEGCVILGDHVTLESGTGAVHTAPGHGQEDYEVCIEYKLPIPMPVLDDGSFDHTAGIFEGLNIDEANPQIIEWLDQQGSLLAQKKITHSYPHCWRCKNPVIFRATDQWFVSMDKTGLREKAMQAMKEVTWYPEWAINRIGYMVQDRPDWCISRQRAWGIPVPVFKCAQCNETYATAESFDAVIALFEEKGADAWFTTDPKEYLPEGTCCPHCNSTELIPEKDILDVWWESGVSHTSVLDNYEQLRRPADLYLEGSDQHRGWFQSSLLTSVAAYGQAPYKAVVSNGFTVDEKGMKMSKSMGNVVDPNEICAKLGADVLRLWVASTDSSQDMSVSDGILERSSDAYRRMRNTFRFLLSNLYDFDYERDSLNFDELVEVDKWALARLNSLLKDCDEGYRNYRFHTVYHALYNYLVTELSSVFMDALKDRLYSEHPRSRQRRSAQTALAEILSMLTRTLQPILAFTCDEVFEHFPQSMKEGKEFASLLDWYTPLISDEKAASYLKSYQLALQMRDVVTKALENARSEKLIGKSQEADVELYLPSEAFKEASAHSTESYEELFIIHKLSLFETEAREMSCTVSPAQGDKCPRCWNIRELNGSADHPELCSRCARALAEDKNS